MVRLLGPNAATRLQTAGQYQRSGRTMALYLDAGLTVPASVGAYQPLTPNTPGAAQSTVTFDARGVPGLVWAPDGVTRLYGKDDRGALAYDFDDVAQVSTLNDESALASIFGTISAGALTVGEETISRYLLAASALTTSNQSLRLTYFTARKSEYTTQVRTMTGATAAGATPTLCRIGLFTVDPSSGDLTLVAATANDTTLWSGASATQTRSWSAPYFKVAGQRYALGRLIVTAAATPTAPGNNAGGISAEAAVDPRAAGVVFSLADLPAIGGVISNGSISATGQAFYDVVLP